MLDNNIMKCKGKTSTGKKCTRVIIKGSYCWQHSSIQKGGARTDNTTFKKPTKGDWDVYGKGYCPHTMGAVSYLSQKLPANININFFDITKFNPPLSTAQLAKKLGVNHTTVPMIFDTNNKFIGGGDNLRKVL